MSLKFKTEYVPIFVKAKIVESRIVMKILYLKLHLTFRRTAVVGK